MNINKKKKNTYKFDHIKKEELKVLTTRRKRILYKPSHKRPKNDTKNQDNTFEKLVDHTIIGLSLSGGGIRSALLNLGVLQELSRIGFLKIVDILSTISGGGYIGGCLSSLLSIKKIDKPTFQDIFNFKTPHDSTLFSTLWERFPFRDHPPKVKNLKFDSNLSKENGDERAAPFPPKIQMTHLRNHANYLMPTGIKNPYEYFRTSGAIVINSFAIIIWLLSLLTIFTTIYMLIVTKLLYTSQNFYCFVPITLDNIKIAYKGLIADFVNVINSNNIDIFISLLLSVFIIYLCEIFSFKLTLKDRLTKEIHNLNISYKCFVSYTIILSVIYTCLLAFRKYTSFLVAPVYFYLFILILLFLTLCICNKNFLKEVYLQYIRSYLYTLIGITLFAIGVSLLLSLMPFLIKIADIVWTTFLQIFSIIILKIATKYINKVSNLDSNIKIFLFKFIRITLDILVILVVILLILLIGHIIDMAIFDNTWLYKYISLTNLISILFVSVIIFTLLSFIDYNRMSTHSFYKDRLSEAFLQTSLNLSSILRNTINMKLTELHGIIPNNSYNNSPKNVAAKGPYHIITASLNLTNPSVANSYPYDIPIRQTQPFMFSRLYIGSDITGYVNTKHYPTLSLARAMTISGAAISPIMGKMTTLATSFILTLLGARLGFWFMNPKYIKKEKDKNKRRKNIKFWAPYLFFELTGKTKGIRKYIYLSDGGHCGDNLGIIPLLKRRAKLVIASDAEHDPNFTFESLNNSLRKIYVDEAIKIDIERPYKFFTPDKNGFTKKHFLIGRILYPDRPWQASWIIVLKSSLTGDEIAPILNYKKKSKNFPNETTTNQFFTEEQFESYRALGRHIASETFSSAIKHIKKHNPWKQIDSFCREIEKLEIGCKTKHTWDDIFAAMWDCENVDFSSWEGFKQKIDKFWKDAKELKKELPNDILIEQLGMLHDWLNKQGNIDASIPLPKTLEEFHKIKDQLSR